jgi:hypothetical protein
MRRLYSGASPDDGVCRFIGGPPPTAPLSSEASAAVAVGNGGEVLDSLERLADLREKGTIDDEEFASLKASPIDEST